MTSVNPKTNLSIVSWLFVWDADQELEFLQFCYSRFLNFEDPCLVTVYSRYSSYWTCIVTLFVLQFTVQILYFLKWVGKKQHDEVFGHNKLSSGDYFSVPFCEATILPLVLPWPRDISWQIWVATPKSKIATAPIIGGNYAQVNMKLLYYLKVWFQDTSLYRLVT